MLRPALLALATGLACLSPAAASDFDSPDASLSWRLGFGGAAHTVQTGYALTLGYRSAGVDATQAKVFEFEVSDALASVRLAGLPLAGHDDRASQFESEAATETGASPWFARKWVWWTAGGLAATAALAGSGGGGNENDGSDSPGCGDTCSSNGPNTSINGVGPDGTGCVGDACAVCNNGSVASECDAFVSRARFAATLGGEIERDRWLDAGTGHMGDLIAR